MATDPVAPMYPLPPLARWRPVAATESQVARTCVYFDYCGACSRKTSHVYSSARGRYQACGASTREMVSFLTVRSQAWYIQLIPCEIWRCLIAFDPSPAGRQFHREAGGAGGRKVEASYTPRTPGCRQGLLRYAALASFPAHGGGCRATLRRGTLLELLRRRHGACSCSQLEGCISRLQMPRVHSDAQTAFSARTPSAAPLQSAVVGARVISSVKLVVCSPW